MVQGSIMKRTIIILSFFLASAIGRGVKKINLVTGSWPLCGGSNVGIKIQSGNNECTVVPKSSVYGNALATWSGADLGSCAPFHVDGTSRVYFQTDATINGFCPEVAQIFIDDEDNTMYEARGLTQYPWQRHYRTNNNNRPHGVTKQWPIDDMYIRDEDEPLLCPPLSVDSCPLTEMYAYRIGSRDRKNCLFECSTVTSVRKTTTYSETVETGFRCVEVGYDSVQFDWCCKTKSTQGGIPRCDESMMTGSIDQSVTTTAAPEVAEIPSQPFAVPRECPQSGCPIRNVKTYYDVQEPQAYEICEIRFECPYVSSADPYDPDSGMECTQTNSPRRKALKCCNDPTAESDLPQCSAVGSRNPPVQNNASPIQNNAASVQNNQPQGSLAYGCPTSTTYQPPLETVEDTADRQRGAVRCCTHDGGLCVTPETPCLSFKTFEEARGECNTRGMRLCKREELTGGKCCRGGCHFDYALVWQLN